MIESEKTFKDIFTKQLEPILSELAFIRYILPKGWIQPSFLFKHNTNNIWFGCSWDWREFYFEAEIGSLYRFKDVLPRVIICGFSFKKKCNTKYNSEFITEQIINLKNRIADLANNNFEKYYSFVTAAQNDKILRLKKYIEKEISSEEELPFIQGKH